MAASEITYEENSGGSRAAIVTLQVLVGTIAPLALTSVGGLGIYAAPVLLPLLWICANACRGGGRWYFTVLGSLVAALSAWALAWGIAPDLQLVLPLIAATAIVLLFVKTWKRDLPAARVAITVLALAAFGAAGVGSLAADTASTSRQVESQRVPKE
jgi:hypothetical protein